MLHESVSILEGICIGIAGGYDVDKSVAEGEEVDPTQYPSLGGAHRMNGRSSLALGTTESNNESGVMCGRGTVD